MDVETAHQPHRAVQRARARAVLGCRHLRAADNYQVEIHLPCGDAACRHTVNMPTAVTLSLRRLPTPDACQLSHGNLFAGMMFCNTLRNLPRRMALAVCALQLSFTAKLNAREYELARCLAPLPDRVVQDWKARCCAQVPGSATGVHGPQSGEAWPTTRRASVSSAGAASYVGCNPSEAVSAMAVAAQTTAVAVTHNQA